MLAETHKRSLCGLVRCFAKVEQVSSVLVHKLVSSIRLHGRLEANFQRIVLSLSDTILNPTISIEDDDGLVRPLRTLLLYRARTMAA